MSTHREWYAGGVPKCNGVLLQRGGSGLSKEEGGGISRFTRILLLTFWSLQIIHLEPARLLNLQSFSHLWWLLLKYMDSSVTSFGNAKDTGGWDQSPYLRRKITPSSYLPNFCQCLQVTESNQKPAGQEYWKCL